MRFHHSTRRGRTKFSQGGGPHQRAAGHSAIHNRWAQLSYCRQTNIHFNRRLPVEVPASVRSLDGLRASNTAPDSARDHIDELLESEAAFGRRESRESHESPKQKQSKQQKQREGKSNGESGAEPLASQMGELSLLGEQRTSDSEQESATRSGSGRVKSRLKMSGQARRWPRATDKRPASSSDSLEESAQQRVAGADNKPKERATGAPEKLDIESARRKLIAQVEKHPFWSNKAARRMRLLELIERRIFIYELVSHCEKRDLEWRYEPYRGGLVAGTGPFAGAKSAPGAALSSLPERLPPTSLLIDSNNYNQNTDIQSQLGSGNAASLSLAPGGSGRLQRALVAQSQPASPMRPANSILQPATAPLNSGAQFAYSETGQPGQLTPPSPQLAAGGQKLLQHQHQQQQSSAPALRKQTIRRSCSSAATSPSHQSNAAQTLTSGVSIGSLGECAAPSWGEPRPLPSAEVVWAIEPPAHLRPAPFGSYIHTSEVADTSFVKRCHGCQGRGRLKCTSCYGVGYEVCISCSGKGTMKSLSSGANAAGGAASSGSHARLSGGRGGGGGSGESSSSMWANAESGHSESRLGAGRYDEPGGVSAGSSALSGAWTSESCHFCHGAGQKRCWICAGRSYNTCTACAGTGQLRCYLNLNITWMNHRDEFVLNNSDAIIPRDRLKLSAGLLLAEEAAWRLAPLAPSSGAGASATAAAPLQAAHSLRPRTPADATVAGNITSADSLDANNNNNNNNSNSKPARPSLEQLVKLSELGQLQAASSKLLERHLAAYGQSERLLRQRHRLTQIECHLVNWEWKRRRGHFVIYGDERKVYIAKYPFKSICNIT